MDNLWRLPHPLPTDEYFESVVQTSDLRIERIVSAGQTTPPGTWLEQDRDEWVVLVQGEATLEFAEGGVRSLGSGDNLLIPARVRHRVNYTSQHPPCIWLAVHGRLRPPECP